MSECQPNPTDTSSSSEMLEARKARLEERVQAQRAQADADRERRFQQRATFLRSAGLISMADYLERKGGIPQPTCERCHDYGNHERQGIVPRWEGATTVQAMDGTHIRRAAGLVYPAGYWCDCEEGQRQQAEYEAGRQAERERLARGRQERVADLFGRAQIPERMLGWTIESYLLAGGSHAAADIARHYLEAGHAVNAAGQERRGLALLGAPGVGKTGLLICVLRARLEAGIPGLFVEFGRLLDQLRATFNKGSAVSEEEVMRAVLEVDVLLLDDIADATREDKPSTFEKKVLYEIVNERNNHLRATLITSNLTQLQIEAWYGQRVWGRLTELAVVVELQNMNMRA